MSAWVKFRDGIFAALLKWLGVETPVRETGESARETAEAVPFPFPIYLSSCWDGANASRRMMNMLSPKFSDAKFGEYRDWMAARGCNTAHLILANEGDGEGAGYWAHENAELSRRRIANLREWGFHVVPWLVTDDSKNYLKKIFADPAKYVNAIADAGLLDGAEFVVLGLEMDECGTHDQWKALRGALKTRYAGRIATHHTPRRYDFADLGDIVCGQLSPGCTESDVKADIAKIKALGKDAIGFEYARGANRKLAQAAIDAGAIGAGNW